MIVSGKVTSKMLLNCVNSLRQEDPKYKKIFKEKTTEIT